MVWAVVWAVDVVVVAAPSVEEEWGYLLAGLLGLIIGLLHLLLLRQAQTIAAFFHNIKNLYYRIKLSKEERISMISIYGEAQAPYAGRLAMWCI